VPRPSRYAHADADAGLRRGRLDLARQSRQPISFREMRWDPLPNWLQHVLLLLWLVAVVRWRRRALRRSRCDRAITVGLSALVLTLMLIAIHFIFTDPGLLHTELRNRGRYVGLKMEKLKSMESGLGSADDGLVGVFCTWAAHRLAYLDSHGWLSSGPTAWPGLAYSTLALALVAYPVGLATAVALAAAVMAAIAVPVVLLLVGATMLAQLVPALRPHHVAPEKESRTALLEEADD